MDIQSTIRNIDAQIADRISDDVGIKMGNILFQELYNAGYISMETFSVKGTRFFEMQLPAYKKKYAVSADLGMAENSLCRR